MYEGRKILGLIPARGGSKRLPGKNIKMLLGKPLISWTIEQAIASLYLDKVIVSTEDKRIADIARQSGADVPFLRPMEYATDTASSTEVILHALDFMCEKGEIYDYIALLEPTSPLRRKKDIDKGIEKLIKTSDSDSLVSVGKIHLEHPMITKKVQNGSVIPYMADLPVIYQSQQADKAYFPYGVLYLSKVEAFRKSGTFYADNVTPLFIERWQNYEIDDSVDFMIVEKIMNKYFDELTMEVK